VDQDSVERIRSATFNLARRGYDRREVDTFLQRLADWLEGGGDEQAHSELVQRELERIGQRTARVLTAAGEAAEAIKADADSQVREMVDEARIAANAARVEADRYAEKTRSDADEYAQAERGKADAYATQTREETESLVGEVRAEGETEAERLVSEARAEAEKLVREARIEAERTLGDVRRQRQDLETVIADLVERRENLLDELERLAGALVGTASEHRQPEPETEKLSADGGGGGADEEPVTEETRETPAQQG
jgi:DivIVA domain-containing protein